MAHAGTAHRYSEKLIAFEHAGAHSSKEEGDKDTLLWIGGLGDGLLTVQYVTRLSSCPIEIFLLLYRYQAGRKIDALHTAPLPPPLSLSPFIPTQREARTILIPHADTPQH